MSFYMNMLAPQKRELNKSTVFIMREHTNEKVKKKKKQAEDINVLKETVIIRT